MFGKGKSPTYRLKVDGKEIDWVQKWKYLGVTLRQGPKFGCCVAETIKKFYGAANSILRIDGRSDEMVMLSLLETHCVSVLSYAIEVIHIADGRQRQKMRVAYNSIFRKLYDYTWRQSVTKLQEFLGRPTWEELVQARRIRFLAKTSLQPPDSIVRALS